MIDVLCPSRLKELEIRCIFTLKKKANVIFNFECSIRIKYKTLNKKTESNQSSKYLKKSLIKYILISVYCDRCNGPILVRCG